jgi:hypothetical protein
MFKRQKTRIKGAFATNTAVLQVSNGQNGENPVGLGLVQGLQLSLSRQYNRIYSLSKETGGTSSPTDPVDAYLIGGRTQGQGQLSRIVGPSTQSLKAFYDNMSDECKFENQVMNFKFKAGCAGADSNSSTGEVGYKITSPVMSAVSINTATQDMIINESVQLVFADMEVQ